MIQSVTLLLSYIMASVETVLNKIADLKSRVLRDSISPLFLGGILEEMMGYCRLTDRPGNWELESLKVGALEVAELIIRRLNAIDADFLLSEADVVQSVSDLGDGVFSLHLANPYDGYFTAQLQHNVLRGKYHSLSPDDADAPGPAAARECWMRVLKVDAQRNNNSISVKMYADKDTPAGKNWPPVKGMRFSRWGNAGDASDKVCAARQTVISLSGADGAITKRHHVSAPIISDANTAAVFGTLPEFLSSLDERIQTGDDGLFADTVVTRRLILLDENTRPVFQTVDRGTWDTNKSYYAGNTPNYNGIYERSLTWRHGHGWLANSNHVSSSDNAPSWKSPFWTHAIGDERLILEFVDRESVVMDSNPACDLELAAQYLGEDVSDCSQIRFDWQRVSSHDGIEDAVGDKLWSDTHQNAGRSLSLGASDLNYQFGNHPESLRYIVTATLMSPSGTPLLNAAGVPVSRQAEFSF